MSIEVSCYAAFCNVLRHAEIMWKLRPIDIYTIFSIYHVVECGCTFTFQCQKTMSMNLFVNLESGRSTLVIFLKYTKRWWCNSYQRRYSVFSYIHMHKCTGNFDPSKLLDKFYTYNNYSWNFWIKYKNFEREIRRNYKMLWIFSVCFEESFQNFKIYGKVLRKFVRNNA